MPTAIGTEQAQGQEQEQVTKEKSGKRGRTRIPPKTLPADFDFGDTPASAAASAPIDSSGAPPKTLPADFDFDKEAAASSSAKPMGGKSARPAWMSSEQAPAVADFNRKQSIIDDWLAVKRDIFVTNSKVKIPDLPPELKEFARKAGYPQFLPGSPEYGHFGTPISERMSAGIIERNIARLKRIGAEIGGAFGEAFLNPATEAEMRQLEQTSPKGAQTLKNIGAVGKSFGSTVGGLVADPTNIALMGGIGMLPRLGQRMVALGFAGMIGKDVYHQSGQLGAIWDRTDIPQERKVELMTNMILNTAMATASATHGARKGEPTPADRANVEEQMLAEIDKLGKDAADRIAARIKQKLTIKEKLQAGMQHAAGTGTKLTEEVAGKVVEHADKVAETRREWVQKAHEAAESQRAKSSVEGRREALESQQKHYAGMIQDNVKSAHADVRADLDTRWNALREKVGTEHPVSPTGIYDAVEASRAMLAGVPSDLKIFNDVFKEITQPDTFVESPEGPKPAPREYIPFGDARIQYSAIGEKAYAADGNLRRALLNVYNAYDQALSKTAADAGVGKQYAAVKKDWSQYMKDWHDMSSMATGGSPLARVYRAVDSSVVADQIKGKFGDRLFGTFARYGKYGADPGLLAKFRNSVRETAALPKVKEIKPPGKFEAPKPPTGIDIPKLSPNPTMGELVETVRRAKVDKARDYVAKQKWHTYDAIMGSWVGLGMLEGTPFSHATLHAAMWFGSRFGWMKFVKSPMGMEWMTKITPADVEIISKALNKYPSEKTEAGKAITSAMEDTVRAGGPPPNVAKFSAILTPEQQREVMKTVKDINELKARGITPPNVTAKASTEGNIIGTPRIPESSAAAGGSGTAAGAAADNADITQARKNLGLSPGQWDSRLLSEAQRLKDARLQGGHAGGGVSSVEELNRPGNNYIVTKSGQITYHGKSFAPESVPAGASHVTLLPDGSIRVNSGPALTSAQETAIRKATEK